MSTPNAKLKINYFYMHYNDAKTHLESINEIGASEFGRISFEARKAILCSAFALEALINIIYEKYLKDDIRKALEYEVGRMSTENKWINVPFLCHNINANSYLESGREPFQSLQELFKIRNSWVHASSEDHISVEIRGVMDWSSMTPDFELKNEGTYPHFVKIAGIDFWKQTKFPVNPFEYGKKHAEQAIKLVEDCMNALILKIEGLSKEYIFSTTYSKITDNEKKSIPIKYIWNKYLPVKSMMDGDL